MQRLYDRRFEDYMGMEICCQVTVGLDSKKIKCLDTPEHSQILPECSCCTTYSERKRVYKVVAQAIQQITLLLQGL